MIEVSLRKRKRIFDEKMDRLYKEFCEPFDAYEDQKQVQIALERIECEKEEEKALSIGIYNEELILQKEASEEAQARLNCFNRNQANYVFDNNINIQLEELRNECIELSDNLKIKEKSISKMTKKKDRIFAALVGPSEEKNRGEWDIERRAENIFIKERKLKELLDKLKAENLARKQESRSLTQDKKMAQVQVKEDSHNLRGFMKQTNRIGDEMKDIAALKSDIDTKLKKT